MLKLWSAWASEANRACGHKYSATERNGPRCQKEIGQISCMYFWKQPLLTLNLFFHIYPLKYLVCTTVHPSPVSSFHATLSKVLVETCGHPCTWVQFCTLAVQTLVVWLSVHFFQGVTGEDWWEIWTQTHMRYSYKHRQKKKIDTQVANALGLLHSSLFWSGRHHTVYECFLPQGWARNGGVKSVFSPLLFTPHQDLKCLSV